MSLLRLIARLDIKGPNVVKGINLEGLRVVGRPEDLAKKYAEQGADELLYIDCVASLYGRNQLADLLDRTTRDVFIPVTVGGGIKSREDVQRLLGAGADKVAINTAAIKAPSLIRELADSYGSQAIVCSVEAKRRKDGWEAYTDNGREKTGRDAVEWAQEAVDLGAGEILLTSIDQEGTQRGFDLDLVALIAPNVPVPVTACGGMGNLHHLSEVIDRAKADAVAMASVLHYNKTNFQEMHEWVKKKNESIGRGSFEKPRSTVV